MLVVPDDGDRRQERDGANPSRLATARCSALRYPACRGAALPASRFAYRDLIGADDPGVGVLQRHGGGLGPGEARRQGYRPFAAAAASRRLPAHYRRRAGAALPGARADISRLRLKSGKAETSKTTTCTRFIFDRGGNRPYYTRPMAPGLPDRVDCAHLADDAVVLERVYALGEMPRLQDLLADAPGLGCARISHLRTSASGRAGATVAIEASAAADMPALFAGLRVYRPPAAARLNFRTARRRARRIRSASSMRWMKAW